MPADTQADPDTRAHETTAMRLMTALLGRKRGPLPRFIASRRVPGPAWRSWDVIAHELYGVTGETVSREGVIKWTRRYGIPMDTHRFDGAALTNRYCTAVAKLGIEIDTAI